MRRPRVAIFASGLAAVLFLGCLGNSAQACHRKNCGCGAQPVGCYGSWGGYHHGGGGWSDGGWASTQAAHTGWNTPTYAYGQDPGWNTGAAGYAAATAPLGTSSNGGVAYAPQSATAPSGYNPTGYTVENVGQTMTQGFVAGATGMRNPAYNNGYGYGYPGYGYGGYGGYYGAPGRYPGFRANNYGFGLGRRLWRR